MQIKRKLVPNHQKQKAARENGNMGLLLLLMVIGGFVFAGNTMMSQLGRMTGSLRRNLAKAVGKKDPVRTTGEFIRKNDKVVEEVTKNMAPYETNERE